ncbi:Beta-galactosidase LacZ [Lactobacillus helveticus]|nr:Beta-galactosidase LacZ [Lactobacillus helveticus]
MLEPEEGKYDFSELDKVVKKLSDANFDIVIGTSTAAMPAWMFKKSIQMLPELIIKADDMFLVSDTTFARIAKIIKD